MRRTILDLHNFGRILALVLSLLPSSLHATEVYVSTIAELQSAINNASVGDIIILANGTYTNSSFNN